jgi:hypothetical protein
MSRLKTNSTSFIAALFVVLGFVASTAQAQYTWLRQTGNSNPGGRGIYQSGYSSTGAGSFLPFVFTNTTQDVLRLDHGQMGVSAYNQGGLRTEGIYANAWSASGFMGGDPLAPGDILGRVPITQPTITTVGSTTLLGQPVTNYIAAWDQPGALASLNLLIQPGETIFFGIAVDNQSFATGSWFPRESISIDPSDTLWTSASGYQPLSSIMWIQHHGYLEGDWAFVVVPAPATVSLLFGTGLFACRRRRS